jgi:iron complex outermembrane recepter protein
MTHLILLLFGLMAIVPNRPISLESIDFPKPGITQTHLETAFSSASDKEQSYPLRGVVTDIATNEPIVGANIIVNGTNIGTSTNAEGAFSLPGMVSGSYTLTIRSVGYRTIQYSVRLPEDATSRLEISLEQTVINFDEIVVTSSPTGSGVRYQPDKAYSGDDLHRRRDISIGIMLDGEPGVAMRSFGPAPARPVIRGLDGERILILENGERMGDLSESAADHAIALDPQATDRLEVVRGPASLLYGTSALGGVINLITSDIPNDWSQGASGGLSYSGATVNSLNSVFGRSTYGWQNHAITGRLSFQNAGNLRTPDGELPNTDLSKTEGSLGYGYRNGTTLGGLSLMAMKSTYGIPESDDPSEKVEIRYERVGAQGRLDFQREHFFDRFQIKFHAARYYHEEIEMEFLPGGDINEGVGVTYDQYSVSSTLNMQHRPVGILDRGVIGLNINGRLLDVGGDDAYTPGEQYINPALFTFQEIPLSDNLRFQTGLRFDFRQISTRTNDAYPDIDNQKQDFNIAGSAGLNLRAHNNIEIGMQFARAHRYPTSEELFADGAHLGIGTYEIGDPTLKTEIGYGSDAFIRYQSSRFQFEIATFLNFIQNFVAFEPTGGVDAESGFPIFQYSGKNARLFGGEVSLATTITRNIILTANADVVYGTSLSDSDEPLPTIPPLRFRTGVEYNSGKKWAGVTVRHVTRQSRVAPEEDPTDGYTLVQFQAGTQLDYKGLHRIVLRGENVFDVSYRDHLSRVEDRQFTMPGRNMTLVYSWNF